jgi:hypothetical protein
MERWYYPLLPQPVVVDEGDAFVFENYQTTVPKSAPLEVVEALFEHEIAHYLFCPYSRGISARLVLSALRALRKTRPSALQDTSNLLLCVSFFQDLAVDIFLFGRGGESREKAMLRIEFQLSGFQNELSSLYAGVISKLFDCGFTCSDELERFARRIARIFRGGVLERGRWEKQCYDTVRVIGSLLKTKPEILSEAGYISDNPYRLKDYEALLGEEVSFDSIARMADVSEFEGVLSAFHMEDDALRRWYHDRSYGVEIFAVRENIEPYPSSLSRWRLDDPVFELDVTYSKSLSPVLIPNVTTYRRIRDEASFHPEKLVPNLLIVLDSSGSMGGHRRGTKTYHAVLAGFKAAHFALRANVEVAVVNFADLCVVQEWTRCEEKIERALIEYIGGNTNIRVQQILELLERSGRTSLVLIITDTHIHNFLTELPHIKTAAERHHIVLFCLDSEHRDEYVTEKLSEVGEVYFIDRVEDLVGLVVEVTEGYLGGGEG